MTAYPKLKSAADAAGAERDVLALWDRGNVFRRSVDERPEDRSWVFYEGPPTANGRPGVHHVIARLCKDAVCRYRTMRGYRVVRKAGWDTHGLPVEIEVESELGIRHKDEIERYGVAEFNRRCRQSVFRYEKDWREFTRRIGYWLDMEHPYVTCDNRYIESVWNILKRFFDAGLVYEGHRIVPYCPRCETSLSSHEVSQGYREVSDPSVFVRFRRRGADEDFLVWTTTPWTLVSNVALAVGPDHEYLRVRHEGRTLVLAAARADAVLGDGYEVLDRMRGADLVGATYEPLFDFFADTEGAFGVVPGDFVSLEEGTGIVHIAPAFGEDDYRLHREHGLPIIQAVTPRGTFTDDIEPWAGRFIKDADPDIVRDLEARGRLLRAETVRHSYPFCWRCRTPLIYYARRSWYIRTTAFRDRMIEANREVTWIPPEVGEYRFGNWLENNVDWSLSRERYWGTPLNVWRCGACDAVDAIGSIDELRERAVTLPDGELDLHRPWVDDVEIACPKCGERMRRVREVIDVWFDSGAMPFAQYHWPWDEEHLFARQFPADFICEGIDQCRGWFYSLLAISVFLEGRSPYRRCLTTELILDRHGQKMSKSRGNAVDPWDVLDAEGADAMRWYLTVTSPPWTPTRFDREGVRETSRRMFDTLRNVYQFFAMYAGIDGWTPADATPGEPQLLDRWILSRFHTLVGEVREWMDACDLTRAARAVQAFVIDEVSNWYVRRSRRRFWKGAPGPDKAAAYRTLWTVLDGVARLIAPVAPFVAEELYLALRGHTPASADGAISVHLEPFPEPDASAVDAELERRMRMALAVTALGRQARNVARVRTRQPLRRIVVHALDSEALEALIGDASIGELVRDELNVRAVEAADDVRAVATPRARPVFPALGRRFGRRVPRVAAAIEALDAPALAAFERDGEVTVDVDGEAVRLGREELTVEIEPVEGFAAARDRGVTVGLDLALDEELRREGAARELVNRIQNARKRAGLEVTDRIRLRYWGPGADWVFGALGELIAGETLALEWKRLAEPATDAGGEDAGPAVTVDLEPGTAWVWIERADDSD